jgi:hypothetical protein
MNVHLLPVKNDTVADIYMAQNIWVIELGRSSPISSRYRSFSILVAELQLQDIARNRNPKKGKLIANHQGQECSFLFLEQLQTMAGNRNHKRRKIITNIIKVQEFLYRCGRVAACDWEQEPQDGEGHCQYHQGTRVSLSLWQSCRP